MSAVTIAIPCYNAGGFLRDCVQSCLRQTVPAKEVIVVNDASTDPETLQALHDISLQPCVRIINNGTNMGKALSLNKIFDSCATDYLILQDADDLAMPNRVERQLDFMEGHPAAGCSSSFVRYINKHGHPIGHGKLDLLSPEKLDRYMKSDEPFGLFCPSVILRVTMLADTSLRFRPQFWPADDIDLWNRIAEAGWQVLAQPEELVCYRIHGSSAVTSGFHATRRKYEFLRACLRARRAGVKEPSEEEFLKAWNAVPPLEKLNRWRKAEAKHRYRMAGFFLGEKRLPSAALSLICSFLLQPFYGIRRIVSQFPNPRSRCAS